MKIAAAQYRVAGRDDRRVLDFTRPARRGLRTAEPPAYSQFDIVRGSDRTTFKLIVHGRFVLYPLRGKLWVNFGSSAVSQTGAGFDNVLGFAAGTNLNTFESYAAPSGVTGWFCTYPSISLTAFPYVLFIQHDRTANPETIRVNLDTETNFNSIYMSTNYDMRPLWWFTGADAKIDPKSWIDYRTVPAFYTIAEDMT